MRILKRKSTLEQLVDAVTDSLEAPKRDQIQAAALGQGGQSESADRRRPGRSDGSERGHLVGFGAGVRERRTVREAPKVALSSLTGTRLNPSTTFEDLPGKWQAAIRAQARPLASRPDTAPGRPTPSAAFPRMQVDGYTK